MPNKFFLFIAKYVRVLAGSLFVLTLGVLLARQRGRLAALAEFFGWKNPAASFPLELPEIDPKEIMRSAPPISINEPVSDDGNVTLLELLILGTLVRRARPNALFEFGTFDGRTTLTMAANAPNDALVYTLDLPTEEVANARANPEGDTKFAGKAKTGAKFLTTTFAERIRQLLGDSASFDYTPYARAVDFVFIDGAHSPRYVANDTKNARAMARGGETIFAWHDYRSSCEGVATVLNRLYAEGGEWKRLRHIRGTALAVLLPASWLEKRL